jgi:hypothetical protein
MASFGNAGVLSDPAAAFRIGFGANMKSGTMYHDPAGLARTGNIDMSDSIRADLQTDMKAMGVTTGGSGTAGYAMIPIYVDPRIVDITRKYTPLVELTPRVANMGTTADFNRIEAKGGATFQAEDAALSETNDTYDRSSIAIKYLYSVGRVTGPSQAAVPGYTLGGFADSAAPTAKQLEVTVKARAMKELEENAIVNGSTGTTASWFDGYQTQIGATNTVDKNTSALALDDVYTAVQYAFDDGGRPNLAVCGSSVFTDLNNLLLDQFREASKTKLSWGFETLGLRTMVGEIPVLPSMYESNTSGSKACYFLDMSEISMRVLQDITYEELAKTNDSEKFMLKAYETYVVKAPEFCASITEISA